MAKKKPAKGKKRAAKNSASKSAKESKRKVGKPTKTQRVIGPVELQAINGWWLRKVPITEIARRLGVHHSTISHHIDKHLKPRWEQELLGDLAEDMAKCAEIETAAWDAYRLDGDTKHLELAKWAIEHRAKIAGHFAAARVRIEEETEVRVAGMTPAEFGAETLKIIQDRAKQHRDYEAAMRRLDN